MGLSLLKILEVFWVLYCEYGYKNEMRALLGQYAAYGTLLDL